MRLLRERYRDFVYRDLGSRIAVLPWSKISAQTVDRYIGLLVDLLLVRRLAPYHANVGKRLVKSPKVYVRDSGLVHALLDIGTVEQLAGHPILGMSWEGFVIENLLSVMPWRSHAFFYRTRVGAEIDLVIEHGDFSLWAIEIKRSLAVRVERGFHPNRAGKDRYGCQLADIAQIRRPHLPIGDHHPAHRQRANLLSPTSGTIAPSRQMLTVVSGSQAVWPGMPTDGAPGVSAVVSRAVNRSSSSWHQPAPAASVNRRTTSGLMRVWMARPSRSAARANDSAAPYWIANSANRG